MQTKVGDDARFWQEIVVAGSPASDYTGFLCRPQFEGRAIPVLAKALLKRRWAVLVLDCLRASRKRVRLFIQSFPAREFEITDYDEPGKQDGINNWLCPYISLPDDWDAYLETLSANTRQKVRRFLRKVDDSHSYRITYADADTVERDVATLIDYWGLKWAERKGEATVAMQESLRQILMDAYRSGTLVMPVLRRGDEPLGVLAFFVDRKANGLLFYATGRDQTFKDIPVGLVLHAHSIRNAIAEGYKVYDFLRGDEPYKLSFASEQRRMRNILVRTKSQKNLGGAIDPIAIPVVFQQAQRMAGAGKFVDAEHACRQVLEVDTLHAGARKLFRKLNDARVSRQQAMLRTGGAIGR
jgi:CelD/BcsL family acetyltransferase involved in cellulose biosynthesis